MFTFGLIGGTRGFDPLILLLMALLVESYVGEMRWLFRRVPHPVVVMGRQIDWLDRKLNRERRSEIDRAIRGAIAVLITIALAGGAGFAIAWLTQHHTFGWLLELGLLIALFAQRGLYDAVRAVGLGLSKSIDAGRQEVRHIVGRDPDQLDEHGIARAAIESLAENFGDGVVAPAFWYVLFGLPGLMIYKAVNTMDSMIGHRTPRHRAFGMTAARTDDVLNFIPARLAGLYIALAAWVSPGGKPLGALKVMIRDAGKHRSINAGWPEGAAAGALGIALAGPRRYRELTVDDPWIGDGTARATVADIRRALALYVVACLINGLLIAAVALIRLSA